MDSPRETIQKWLKSMTDLSYDIFATTPFEVDAFLVPKDRVNNDIDRQIIDVHGDLTGKGGFTCNNNDYFEGEFFGSIGDRYGHLTKITTENGCYCVGRWSNGLMEGMFDLEESDRWKRAIYHKGLKHGLERTFGGAYTNVENLQRVAFYCNDSTMGLVWECLPGGAYMLGRVDPETELFCGKGIIFIYPDLETTILCRYENGAMVSGYMCQLEEVSVDTETFMLSLRISEKTFGPRLKCDVSTDSVISKFPLVPDLWEAQLVEVKNSEIGQHAGQGLYLKRDVEEGQIVALFNGIRCQSSRNNSKDKSPDQSYDYRIRLNGDTDIDIPPFCTSLQQYCATLGHKANHSFSPNAKWSRLQHPRFGLIVAIRAIKAMAKGTEVLVNYGMGMADAPMWYKNLWVKHLREEKHLSDQEISDWCSRQYAMNGRLIELPLR